MWPSAPLHRRRSFASAGFSAAEIDTTFGEKLQSIIAPVIYLPDVYEAPTSAATWMRLCGIIAYYGSHYIAFFYSKQKRYELNIDY